METPGRDCGSCKLGVYSVRPEEGEAILKQIKMVNKIYMQADEGQAWRLRVLKSFLVCFLS